MTKRDAFVMLIKAFGLYAIITTLVSGLPSNLTFAFYDLGVQSLAFIFATVALIVVLFALLIFKSGVVVRILKLDAGFDDDHIELQKVKRNDLYQLAIFLIGGLIFFENLPHFIGQTYFFFRGYMHGYDFIPKEKIGYASMGISLLLGYILFTNSKTISLWIQKKQNVNDQAEDLNQ